MTTLHAPPSCSSSLSSRDVVCLFKKNKGGRKKKKNAETETEIEIEDPYGVAMKERGYHRTVFLEVLSFSLQNQDELFNLLSENKLDSNYDGLIVTSSQALESLMATAKLLSCSSSSSSSSSSSPTSLQNLFRPLRERSPPFHFFCVAGAGKMGATTLSTASKLGLPCPSIPPSPSAQELATSILSFFSSSSSSFSPSASSSLSYLPPPPRLLFLCGDRSLTDLPRILSSSTSSVSLESLIVYSTNAKEHNPSLLKAVKDPEVGRDTWKWACFFSPSGVEAVANQGLLSNSSSSSSSASERIELRFAAIGKTSADAVRKVFGVCHAVASNPSPEGLSEALFNFDNPIRRDEEE